ncbi:MAG: DivIVA domain-containing protein [Oscillospiraceae bacterium]|jgi:cell division initiation protein|nr:DivIVA domain-containing protein [Oscillospiraceae bacterium]
MLTPAEISGKEFVKAVFGGYDMNGVDDFLETVTVDYTALYKENGILKSKLKVLVEKIEEYRSTEDAMRGALLAAQKTADDLVAEATRHGAEIAERMERDAEERRREIEAQIADERARLDAAVTETEAFVNASKEIIGAHIEFLSALNSVTRAHEPPPPEPTQDEEELQDAISSEVERIVGETDEPDAEAEPTKTFIPKAADADAEEEVPAKDKFDDLKFGINFKKSE